MLGLLLVALGLAAPGDAAVQRPLAVLRPPTCLVVVYPGGVLDAPRLAWTPLADRAVRAEESGPDRPFVTIVGGSTLSVWDCAAGRVAATVPVRGAFDEARWHYPAEPLVHRPRGGWSRPDRPRLLTRFDLLSADGAWAARERCEGRRGCGIAVQRLADGRRFTLTRCRARSECVALFSGSGRHLAIVERRGDCCGQYVCAAQVHDLTGPRPTRVLRREGRCAAYWAGEHLLRLPWPDPESARYSPPLPPERCDLSVRPPHCQPIAPGGAGEARLGPPGFDASVSDDGVAVLSLPPHELRIWVDGAGRFALRDGDGSVYASDPAAAALASGGAGPAATPPGGWSGSATRFRALAETLRDAPR